MKNIIKLNIVGILIMILFISTSCKDEFINDYTNIDSYTEMEENWMDTDFYRGLSVFSYCESGTANDTYRININVNDIIKKYAENDTYIQIDINKVPHYYDVKNNTFIGCCIDPLCDHSTENCPFFGSIDGCILYDNKMFFTKLGFESEYDKVYCYYDMVSKNIVPLRGASLGRSILTQVYYNNHCYYYDVLQNENSDVWSVNFLRQDISTKNIEVLDSLDGYQNQIFFAKDDKLYFNDKALGQLYYTTTEDVTKRDILIDNVTKTYMYNDDYLYFIELFDNGETTISRISFEGNEYKTYDINNVFNYYIVNDYIYYMDNNQVVVETEDNGYVTISSRNIYKYNVLTNEHETVITLDEGLAGVDIIDFIIDGNYLYAQFQLTENGRDYYSVGGVQGILRINLSDESYFYISPGNNLD